MVFDVSERLVERRRRKPAPPRPDHFAAEAEPAIDGAGIDELEQHPVRVAVHDALDRAVRVVADRVMAFLRLHVQLARIGHELPRDRIVRIGRIDQVGERRRDGDGVARRHLLPASPADRGHKLRSGESRRRAQGFSNGGTHGWPRFRGFGPLCSMGRAGKQDGLCEQSMARQLWRCCADRGFSVR